MELEAKQIATSSLSKDVTSYWSKKLYDKWITASVDPKSYYTHILKVATNYEQWAEAAAALDEYEGNDEWKKDPVSTEYDWELVQNRLNQLRIVRDQNNPSAMIFQLRTSLARNLGDMGKSTLYAHSRVGTKVLISTYIEEVTKQLNWICDETSELDYQAKHDFFMNIRQSFGRTALLLSGGGTLGLYHLGVLKCLFNARLLPRVISGASSGSIMAALLCTKTVDEIPHMFDPTAVKLDVFERDGYPDTPFMRLKRLLSDGQLYDVEILTEAMKVNLGDVTFQEAFNRTRWILNITVSSSTVYDMPRLLNYLTAPDVVIWSAVAASCAVPVFYGSSPLYAKDKNGNIVPWNPSDQLYIDGSVENDLPMNRLSELFNVNHFIVCQVNPHVIPFLPKSNAISPIRQAASFWMHLANTEVQHRCTQLTELGIFPSIFSKMKAVMSQKYSGDITIVPDVNYTDFFKVLSNPSQEFVAHAIAQGDRATWPKMSIIKNHLQIELTIDTILYRLRLRHISQIPAPLPAPRPHLETRSTSLLSFATTSHHEKVDHSQKKYHDDDDDDNDGNDDDDDCTTKDTKHGKISTMKTTVSTVSNRKAASKYRQSTKRDLWMTSN
ncbi:acyl transferase/acyl hydrolase/lysophospholipase [Halteromyces radiatus]|uniref:acyl transferase/acyl hydrolase/lysophospholipase n=1 Tax=Halteromyces radiatus TaxID=101107 RepID=UPI002220D7CE|nr:acyl transferase/acyl hydrolase/lysophospholipase [Halteromyces radiatus]KAI8079954.1 acyl transferase/acyl hydrolase/lysophospholipase [Halteromyces radiatus]